MLVASLLLVCNPLGVQAQNRAFGQPANPNATSDGYTVQVGIYHRHEDAIGKARELRGHDPQGTVVKSLQQAATIYRVIGRIHPDRRAARKAETELKRRGFEARVIRVRLVSGTVPTAGESSSSVTDRPKSEVSSTPDTALAMRGTEANALIYAGRRLKVTGVWTGSRLRATEIEERDSKDPSRGQVSGRIDTVAPAQQVLRIGPVTVEWSAATRFEKLEPRDLQPGVSVKASGQIVAPGRIAAESMKTGSSSLAPGAIEVVGAGAASPGGVLAVLGLPVDLPSGVSQRARSITRRPDDRRPDDQLTVDLYGRPLIIGGEVGATVRHRNDFELDPAEQDDVTRLDLDGQLELLYLISDDVAAFLELKAAAEKEVHTEDDKRKTEEELERGEMWLYVANVAGSDVSLQIGRQNYGEDREWWWDDDLDSVRGYYDRGPLRIELGIGEELAKTSTKDGFLDPADDDIRRILSAASWEWSAKQSLGLFFLYHDDHSDTPGVGTLISSVDEDENDAELWWFGARAIGEFKVPDRGKLSYWLDTAVVRGDEQVLNFDDAGGALSVVEDIEKFDVRGWAIDLGASWTFDVHTEPTLTLGYAHGSGDSDLGDNTDKAFRQTGLQDNAAKFEGVNRFRYYGELLNPELSNLNILTMAIGFPLLTDSSIEFVYHHYRQDRAAPFLRDGRIDASPTGNSKDIGQELDIVVGLEEWKHLELELIGAMFEAGDAYGSLAGERAFNFKLNLDYSF